MKNLIPCSVLILILLLHLPEQLFAQNLAFNELCSQNQSILQDEDGDFEDWIELVNFGTDPINLVGFGLSDDPNLPFKWTFPAVTIPGNSFLLVWASDKNKIIPGQPLHTNFKISGSGEALLLTNPTNQVVAQSPAVELDFDVSYGRQPDGTGDWLYFYNPTPGTSNLGIGLGELLQPPTFSHESGLFTSGFNLELSSINSNAVIVYTLDGSEPDINNTNGTSYQYKNVYPLEIGSNPGPFLNQSYTSNIYSGPIQIVDRSPLPNEFTAMNTSQYELFTPPLPVRKGTIIRAKVVVDDISSKTVSKTYFVWPQGNPFELPIISLQIQENHLFDYNDGIYTAGLDFDTWRANNPTNNQWWRPEWNNYWRSGIDWEYPMHVEVFEPQNFESVINMNAGFRIHGNNSRILAVKNLRWYARSTYDTQTEFVLDLFDEPVYGAVDPFNNQFQKILMRGDGTGGPVAYDVVFNRLMYPVYPAGLSRIQPAIHFINGEFWGITAFRDRLDQDHFSMFYGLNANNIACVDCKGLNCELESGNNADYDSYVAMRDFILNENMADPAKFLQASEMLDMESFINNMVLQVFSADNSYERIYWKAISPENNGYGDGKWRLTSQDFEAAMDISQNWMTFYTDTTIGPNGNIFGELLVNTDFRNAFINRYADLLNTAFLTSRFTEIVNNTFDEVTPYLQEHANRFPSVEFYEEIDKTTLLDWAANHPDVARQQMLVQFDISGFHQMTLTLSDPNAGHVQVNTVEIKEGTPGVNSNPYPWNGQYFNNVPVRLIAFANPGYSFSHWSGDFTGTSDTLIISSAANYTVQANYIQNFEPGTLIHFWHFDNNLENDTPLESLATTFSAPGLSGELNYESCLVGYPFDDTHPNWRKASMERRNRPTEINYRPEGNGNIEFIQSNMRGIQIKQPFESAMNKNEIILNLSTYGYDEIRLSLAADSDGAADSIQISYWSGTSWTIHSTQVLEVDYTLIEIDFTTVSASENNPDFKIRLNFLGDNLTEETGLRVHFNNIAIEGKLRLNLPENSASIEPKIHPNPAKTSFNLTESQQIQSLTLFDPSGRVVEENLTLPYNVQSLPQGLYLLKIEMKNGVQKILRLSVQTLD